jgi:alkyl hydroperoxide reductase subunit AhpC
MAARAVFIMHAKKLKLSIHLLPTTTGHSFTEILRVIDSRCS